LAYAYCSLSMVHFDLDNKESALSLTEKAFKLAQKNDQKGLEGLSKICLGRMLGKTDPSKSDEAEASILEGIRILESLKLRPS
jgi:hypothetical protein